MPLVESIRGLQLNRAHPLARDLFAFWPCCEGAGMFLGDISGNARHLQDVVGAPAWKPGKLGHVVQISTGTNEYFCREGDCPESTPLTMACWVMTTDDTVSQCALWAGDHASTNDYWALSLDGTDNDQVKAIARNIAMRYACASKPFMAHTWHHVAAVFVSSTQRHAYIDGGNRGTNTESREPDIVNTPAVALGELYDSTQALPLSGRIAMAGIWTRALSDGEIYQLYKEPSVMFERRPGLALLFVGAAEIVNLSGTSAAQATVSGVLEAVRCIAGQSGGSANVSGSLNFIGQVVLAGATDAISDLSAKMAVTFTGAWFTGSLQFYRNWLLGALFGGMTAEALRLGTVLSGGWFWMRHNGCTSLYRGPSMEQIDFANTLAVVEYDASGLSPPTYVEHDSGSTYFYVVRRFNEWGHHESTLCAAVRVAIGSTGELAEPQPNDIFTLAIEQADGNRVELLWFYCPLQQQSRPVRFNIYWDNETGQIGYENAIGRVNYSGPRFYTYRSDALEAGRYVFATRAEDAGGTEDESFATVQIDLATTSPSEIEILSAEAV
ncbi:MAG: LamG domain-containing protein [Phycisphaerales bacterium]|nr:MAG: LamG domain-containing protein [Phycisphaerales bacterium]